MAVQTRTSRSTLVALLSLLALVALCSTFNGTFVTQPAIRGSTAAATAATAAALLPVAAQAVPDQVVDMDVGSSVSLAGLYEPLLLGICLGLFPTTLLGLFVAAWLQFKKGPTLGL
mmetsp:Transcript_50577/g.109782  ORF Transcript_50577/g.109782 Transcript_50577/m.109782 type:complete len:116 (+) Transcript_50577:52-399(+)|eukprot:CAMPEP_0170595358 /NCGR_PEP_ID=MMETSP0224-20130122/14517_1 /TAXON_ID=285029 /ORGANISM="Togula jolla, Strain CCCM 725" /LENGTH=115 /DNA_ID=CAMNT_0010919529 /DNA_START=52 /DNA_END=399 /DNA_ORIENTATION=+